MSKPVTELPVLPRDPRPAISLPFGKATRRVLLRLLPRTMGGLIATSKILAMIPLVLVLVAMSLTLDRLLLRSEQLISDGQRIEVFGARLRTELIALERVARQHNALGDPMLLEIFHQRLRGARLQAESFDGRRLPARLTDTVHGMVRQLDELAALSQQTIELDQIARLSDLVETTEGVVQEARASINTQIDVLRLRSERARGLLLSAVALVMALTAALTFGLSRLIARPMHQLRGAIVALGTGNYRVPVGIEYPREMARLGEKLEWLRRRLHELEADKDRFLAHVSHELKTPLASLREGTDLLLDPGFGVLAPRQSEVARILAESALDLDAQIRNLLAYAEWRRGYREVELSWVEGRSLIDQVIASQRLPLEKRRLRVQVDLQAARIWGHEFSLRVSLSNLLSNAIKHSPSGNVIEISVDRRYGRCMLSVRDHGRGVPEADRERILQPFVRGSDPEEPAMRGTGVGLSIVSETVKAHGGSLEVLEAEPGARFVLSWPCPGDDDD